jgi:hypothetical protein
MQTASDVSIGKVVENHIIRHGQKTYTSKQIIMSDLSQVSRKLSKSFHFFHSNGILSTP